MVVDGKELRPIPGWEDLYWISRDGNVYGLKHQEWLKPYPVGYDRKYLGVKLFRNSIGYSYRLHKLVAQVWVNNPNGYDTINHKDLNTKNNSADNLEWVTFEQNNNYLDANKRRSEALKGKPRGIPVKCVETGQVWESIRACAIDTGFNYYNLKSCVKGHHDTVHGLHFVKDED